MKSITNYFANTVSGRVAIIVAIVVLLVLSFFVWSISFNSQPTLSQSRWTAPDTSSIPHDAQGELIRYGRKLVANTSHYLGPKGTVLAMSNGMNCQNCHLDAGTRHFGNNYSAVASNYPKFRARSGTVEDVQKRINDCFQRSLNGQSLPEGSLELSAMTAYILWVGHEVPKSIAPDGSGLVSLPLMERAADVGKGKLLFADKCASCHGGHGEGALDTLTTGWRYPPLAGQNSYNDAAGIFRLSRFAGFVKANMPLGATVDKPLLTDEECWDIAAFVNSLPRPHKDTSQDWPDVTTKPFDYPFGPFKDSLPESQHKFGPFHPIEAAQKK